MVQLLHDKPTLAGVPLQPAGPGRWRLPELAGGASGNDARAAVSTESVYGTRVAPARFFPFLSEGIDYAIQTVDVPVLGLGQWTRVQRTSTQGGSGPLQMPVMSTGFGWWLDKLHGNTVTPVQQASTTAYLQTHTLSTPAPTTGKSFSMQLQTPAVASATLLPQDFTGCMIGGVEFTWDENQALYASFQIVPQKLDLSQSLATYSAPAAWVPFTFMDATVQIGGSPVANILGAGSLSIQFPRRDDAYYLGSGGYIAAPEVNDKPTATAAFNADFTDLTHFNRTLNSTIADLVVKFQYPVVIASTYYPYIEITLQDCRFVSPRPQIDGPGLLSQGVAVTAASSTGDPPILKLMSTDTAI